MFRQAAVLNIYHGLRLAQRNLDSGLAQKFVHTAMRGGSRA